MRSFIALIMFLAFSHGGYAQSILGKVETTDNVPLPGVLIYNTTTKMQANSQSDGRFKITASIGDELRFIRDQYPRVSKVISGSEFLEIRMERLATEIQEVVIDRWSLSGDLSKDSKMLARVDKKEQLRQDIGLPKGPEKPREKPAEVKNVLIGAMFGMLDVQGVYDLVSGDARRQKALYKYEDEQETIQWVISSFGVEYFKRAGIPEDKISDFISFSFGADHDVLRYAKRKNFGAVMMGIEKIIPQYLARIKT